MEVLEQEDAAWASLNRTGSRTQWNTARWIGPRPRIAGTSKSIGIHKQSGSGFGPSGSGFGFGIIKQSGSGSGYIYISIYIHIFIYVITKKLIARHCFSLFSIRQNKTEQNQSAAIVSHCSRFGKINTMEYNGIPKSHKFPQIHCKAF